MEPKDGRFWGAALHAGVRPGHLASFYLAAFSTIMLAVAAAALQPYLLGTFLGLPVREYGSASGQVGFAAEVVLFAMVGLWGVLSDRLGRRAVYVAGFVVMAAGFLVTPLVSSLGGLVLARCLYSVGVAGTTAMLSTVLADYVRNEDRGKATAIMGVMNGLGAVAAALGLAKLPRLFAGLGDDGRAAGLHTYWVVAGLSLLAALVLRLGLRGRGVEHGTDERTPFVRQASEGIRAAREDVGVALSYLAAFVARADLAVAGTFFPLWLTAHHASAAGSGAPQLLDEAAARGLQEGGMLVAIAGGAGLMFAPVIGILCDRIHRVTALIVGLSMNVLGYGLVFFVLDPTQPLMKLAAVIIGFGQVGGVIASQVLIQQQAPARCRGSVVGTFGTCGAAGIMFCLFAGGKLFDAWRGAGPFVLLALLNLGVIGFAMLVKARVQAPALPRGPLAMAH